MISFILSSLASVLCLFIGLHFLFVYIAKVNYIRKIPPSFEPLPLFGNLFHLLKGTTDLFIILRSLARKHKRFYRIWIFSNSVVGLLLPEDIEVILSSTKHIQKSQIYGMLGSWLNEGLLTSTGAKWQNRRKILTPTFHFNILQQFVKIFGEHSNKLIKNLDKECDAKVTNIVPYMTEVALHNVCETAMGTSLGQNSAANEYKSAIYRWGEIFIHRLLRPWLHPEFIFWKTKIGRETKGKLEIMHEFTRRVIADRKDMLQQDLMHGAVMNGKGKRLAMLDLLLSAASRGENIDDAGIKEEVDTFTFEGHDTTSMALSFTLMCIANYPEVQNKVYEEIFEIFGEDDRAADIQELNNMKYLEMVIKESLRLYPSVPFISRVLTKPLQLSDCTIPSGVIVDVHIFDLHRNPELYPDPEAFIPERFSPDECAKRHPFAYIPFSAGPRNCIGQKFAILELKSVLSTILRHYTLQAITKPEDLEFICDLVLRSNKPIKVKFTKRLSCS